MKGSRDSNSDLLFDWHREERTGLWLVSALLVTAGGFALLFILFRVITPEAPKLTSRSQQMIVLNPNVDADRALINRAVDRSFTLLPADSPSVREIPGEAKVPSFEPAVATFELKLKAPQIHSLNHDSPLLFAADIDTLPPLPRLLVNEARPIAPAQLKTVIRSDSALRISKSPPLDDIALTDPTRPQFQLAIGRLGQVIMALPQSSSEDPAVMVKLHTALSQMRFEPTGKDLEWAEVTFAWIKEPPP
jgi:hypothetical protein